jgi:hypothetical protein
MPRFSFDPLLSLILLQRNPWNKSKYQQECSTRYYRHNLPSGVVGPLLTVKGNTGRPGDGDWGRFNSRSHSSAGGSVGDLATRATIRRGRTTIAPLRAAWKGTRALGTADCLEILSYISKQSEGKIYVLHCIRRGCEDDWRNKHDDKYMKIHLVIYDYICLKDTQLNFARYDTIECTTYFKLSFFLARGSPCNPS